MTTSHTFSCHYPSLAPLNGQCENAYNERTITSRLALRTPYNAPMTNTVFEQSREKMLLAASITGLSYSALAKASGVAQSTITRAISRQVTTTPSQTTMGKIDAFVTQWLDELARTDPEKADGLREKWIAGTASPSQREAALDVHLLQEVIVDARHALRHVWDTVPAETLAEMIVGLYRENIAKRDAESPPHDNSNQ